MASELMTRNSETRFIWGLLQQGLSIRNIQFAFQQRFKHSCGTNRIQRIRSLPATELPPPAAPSDPALAEATGLLDQLYAFFLRNVDALTAITPDDVAVIEAIETFLARSRSAQNEIAL